MNYNRGLLSFIRTSGQQTILKSSKPKEFLLEWAQQEEVHITFKGALMGRKGHQGGANKTNHPQTFIEQSGGKINLW